MRAATTFAPLAFATAALGAIVPVKVGSGGLKFDPESIVAKAGDVVQFTFYPANHSVVQGNFDGACNPRDQGFFSGFNFATSSGPSNKTFEIAITAELAANPIYLYCSEASHCQAGMVAIINEQTVQGHSLAQYKANAASASSNVSPSSTAVVGGSVVSGSATATGSGSASTSTGTVTSTATTTSSGSGSASTSKSSSSASGNAAAPTMVAGKLAAGLVAGAALFAL